MGYRLITFTRAEGRALAHFLRQSPEAVRACLPDADRWPCLWVNARREEFARTLALTHPFVMLYSEAEGARRSLDLAILSACVARSDYHMARPWTADGRENTQAYNGGVRMLWNARGKIAAAFGIDPEAITFPQV